MQTIIKETLKQQLGIIDGVVGFCSERPTDETEGLHPNIFDTIDRANFGDG
jgi:hypothetical protein